MKEVLVLAPHTDDMEFGCGGTIKRLSEEGARVHVLAFSTCRESLPNNFTTCDIKKEQYLSADILGINKEDIQIFDIPVRRFNSYRQEILEILIGFKRQNNVELVFTPSCSDIHQDHAVVCMESIRAFKNCSLLGYELPWNNLVSNHAYYYLLKHGHIKAKEKAIDCFRSQQHRSYKSSDACNIAKVRGLQVNANYAEAFEMIRGVVF